MLGKFVGGALVAGGALGAYEINRLYHEYPVNKPKSYLTTPEMLAAQPSNPGRSEYMYARVRVQGHGLDTGRALEKHIDIFFENPMLQAESALFRAIGYRSPRPSTSELRDAVKVGHEPAESYLSGFFPVVYRDPAAVLVWWKAPGPADQPLLGGTQVLAADASDPNNIEIAYGCVALGPPAPQEGTIMRNVHLMYMRFLLDSARREFERRARNGEL
jgi:hypothetical protein